MHASDVHTYSWGSGGETVSLPVGPGQNPGGCSF